MKTEMNKTEATYKIGSDAYCDIANDEGGNVCADFSIGEISGNSLYERFCGKSADGVEWPENGTEEEIRRAARDDWERKLQAAGYTKQQ